MLEREIDRMQAGHQRQLSFTGYFTQQTQGVVGQYRIHRRNRLVGQQQVRTLVQRAGNPHPLLLPT